MRIGIDCRSLESGEIAGVGNYTLQLVSKLAQLYPQDTFVLFFGVQPAQHVAEAISHFSNTKIVQLPFGRWKRFLPFLYSHWIVSRAIQRQNLDVFHGPANVLPLAYSGQAVITIHDLTIFQHPEWFRSESPFVQKIVLPNSVKKAQKIVAVSHATEKELTLVFPGSEKKVDVIYEAAADRSPMDEEQLQSVQKTFSLPNRYMLFLGTIEPRKNLARLVQAFDAALETLGDDYTDVQLLIAGGKGWKNEEVFLAINSAEYVHNIRVLGYVSDEQKYALLEQATAFAFPSLWEGFGLPVLEAMQAGIPVLTTTAGALSEVAGDAALTVEPKDSDGMRDAIARLLSDDSIQAEYAERGKKRAAEFSWERCAKETYAVYKEVVDTQ